MYRFFTPIIFLLTLSCGSLGIKLSETQTNPSLKTCSSQSEIRSYKILFLLPFVDSSIGEQKIGEKDSIQSIREYAKPWDIGFTFIGFLFSLTSSTKVYSYCTEAEVKKMSVTEKLTLSLPHYKWLVEAKPAEQILFSKDDSQLTEEEKLKLTSLAQTLSKSEEKFQIILVGKTNTSGDIAYQTRLAKKRADEIKTILTGVSYDPERIQTVFTDKDFGGTDLVSSISIFLVKE